MKSISWVTSHTNVLLFALKFREQSSASVLDFASLDLYFPSAEI